MKSAANALKDIGARIRHVRGGLTQADFAVLHGVSLATYRNYEKGERPPLAEFLSSLLKAGWNVNWVLTGDGAERLQVPGVREEHAVYAAVSQDLSVDTLSIALELADEALHGLWLPRREYAELVAGVYAMLQQGLPYADILDLSRPATKKAGKQGVDDVGGAERDSSGEGVAGQRTASRKR